jgi:hypothetical protein
MARSRRKEKGPGLSRAIVAALALVFAAAMSTGAHGHDVSPDDPTTVITRSGKGSVENPPVIVGSQKCTPGNRAVVGVGISGGAAGNRVTASAFCFPKRVAGPANAVDPGAPGGATDVQGGAQVQGGTRCPVFYTGSAPDSTWRVICTFF